MRAILLAAGLGTRLGPRTANTPKCMIPVGGRPMLERVVEELRHRGVTELAINLHHRPEVVTGFFGDGTRHRVRIRYSFEPTLLGTAGALRPLVSWLTEEGRFLVVYADNLIDCDVEALASLHDRLDAVATVALYRRDDVSASGVAEVDGDGRIQAFKEKPPPGETESRWVNAGLLLCEPRVMDYVPDGASDLAADVLPALIRAGETLGGYQMGAGEALRWIDTPEDLAELEALLAGAR